MLWSSFYQQSLCEVDPDEIRLPRGSFERGLRDLLPRIVSVDDFRELHPSAEGASTCDPIVLTGMLLLQFRFGLSDGEVVDRARRDLGFRFALALEKDVGPPSVASLKRFRADIRRLKGPDWLFKLSLGLPVEEGHVSRDELQGVDSTNVDQRGATLDTFNLIATAIRHVVAAAAGVLELDVRALARDWLATRYLARSLKGAAAIDWSDDKQRNALLTQEIVDAKRIGALAAQVADPRPVGVPCARALLDRVIRQDVEELPDGSFRIAHGTVSDRIISITDPAARHGRKSASKTFNGFKVHLLGTLTSQFVTAIEVTGGNIHDAAPTVALLNQADASGLKPEDAVGDNAYGSGANRRACAELGVTLHTKLPSPSREGFTKRDFAVDLAANSVTCPNGVTTRAHTLVKDPNGSDQRVAKFTFPKSTCQACPLAEQCGKSTRDRGRVVTLSVYEAEIQQAQHMNATPEEKKILRERAGVERLIAHLVRMGMRQARYFGMELVQFQAFMIAAAYNLQRYMTLAAAAV